MGNPGSSGFGGLLRNNDGAWMKGFYSDIGITDNFQVELLATFHGLNFA